MQVSGPNPRAVFGILHNQIFAGFDTSATTLAALFFYLARFPRVYSLLQEEIQRTFTHSSEIRSGSKLSSCTYLNACITETLRMSPATPGFPLREVLSPGLVLDGHHIPPGIDVGTCIYALHHNGDYFENPDSFIPERWIQPEEGTNVDWDKRSARQLKAYSPFSIGPRSCPGRQFAMMEISLTIARVVSALSFQFAEEDGLVGGVADAGKCHREEEYRLRAHVTSSGCGPFLTFKKKAE